MSGNVNPNRSRRPTRSSTARRPPTGRRRRRRPRGRARAPSPRACRCPGLTLVDDLPRAPGRDERGRHDERPRPRLHDGRPAAVGLGHVGRVGHDGGATVSGDVNPNARRHDVQGRVRHDASPTGRRRRRCPPGSGSSAVAASVPLTGLTSSTTYHARLVATSAGGTTNGPDLTFTTGRPSPPSVTNTSVGSITTTGATVSGNVNPNARRDDLQGRVRHDRSPTGRRRPPVSAGLRLRGGRRERSADRPDRRRRPTTRGWSRRAPAARRTAPTSPSRRATCRRRCPARPSVGHDDRPRRSPAT